MTSKRTVRVGLGLAFAGLLGLAQHAVAQEAASRPDALIQRDAERAILGYAYYGVFDAVGVDVKDGQVTLVGSVNQPYQKDDIERRVAKVAGVRVVSNEIRVQPVSFHDESLRAELFRAIYGRGVLINPSMVDPPVRIIVNNGRITLVGYVGSEVERVMVGHIARGTLSFGVDNQLKLDNERGSDRKAE
jgi:osmotically-inducible protein OsmY